VRVLGLDAIVEPDRSQRKELRNVRNLPDISKEWAGRAQSGSSPEWTPNAGEKGTPMHYLAPETIN